MRMGCQPGTAGSGSGLCDLIDTEKNPPEFGFSLTLNVCAWVWRFFPGYGFLPGYVFYLGVEVFISVWRFLPGYGGLYLGMEVCTWVCGFLPGYGFYLGMEVFPRV
jgi:hypothetical protein